MTTRSSARRVPAARVPKSSSDGGDGFWARASIPIVIVIAVLAMLSIPLYGYVQQTILPGREALARVRGQEISMDQLVRRLRYERALLDLRKAQPEEFATVPMSAVFDLVDGELIRQGAAAAGVLPTSDEIADEKVAIARNGLSGEAWGDIATTNATRKSFERYLFAQLPSRADQVRLEGFTVSTPQQAELAATRLRAGEPIDVLATELSSQQKFKDQKGVIGWVPRGLREAAFDTAVFGQTAGSVPAPIDTTEGYFVVRVLEQASDKLIDPAPLKELQAGSLRKWLEAERQRDNPVELYWDSEKYAWANDQVRK